MAKALTTNKRNWRAWRLAGCGWLLLAGLFASACQQQPPASGTLSAVAELTEMKRTIRERFPGVRQLSTTELAGWLASPQSAKPLLLDARAPAEYAVSHLRGAQLAASEEQALAVLQAEPRDRLVVVYCSVGYRSSALAEQLQARGFTNVYNLEGSIFEWANEGRPVYQSAALTGSSSVSQGEQSVKRVHPYDAKWGAYLKPALWSPLP